MNKIQSLRDQLKSIAIIDTTITEGSEDTTTITEGKVTSALTAALLAVLSSQADAGGFDTDKLKSLATKLANTATTYAGEAATTVGDKALDLSRKAAGVSSFSSALSDIKHAVTGESIFVELFSNAKIASSNLATLIKTSTTEVIDVISTYSKHATTAEEALFKTKYQAYYTEAVFKKKFNAASDAIDSALMESEEYANIKSANTIVELKQYSAAYIKKWISLTDNYMASHL